MSGPPGPGAAPPGMGVRARLVVLIALLIGGIAAFISFVIPRRAEDHFRRLARAEAESYCRMAAFTVAPSVYFADRETARETLANLAKATEVAFAVVEDPEGAVFAASELSLARSAAYWEAGLGQVGQRLFYRARLPIEHEGRRIGTVSIGLSLDAYQQELERLRAGNLLAGAFALLIGLAATLVIGSYATGPLRRMVQTARRITAGDLRQRAEEASGEAGQLADAFNAMLDRLEASRKDLEALNRGLEDRVLARTQDLRREVEERRSSEAALADANERFARAAAAVNGAIYDWDVEQRRVLWSDGMQRVFGYPPEEVAPTPEWWKSRIHPDDVSEVEKQSAEALASGKDFASEYRFRGRDGTWFWVWDRAVALPSASGRGHRIVGVIEDVTAIRSLADQLQQSQKMEAVGRLAGGIAHDFNNLLTTILGFAQVVHDGLGERDPHRADVDEIRKAGERAAALTRQLLAFSRRRAVDPQYLDVNRVVGGLEKMLRRLIGEDVVLMTDLDPKVGLVKGDPGQFEQILVNAVVNSRDALPRGGEIHIRTRRDARPPGAPEGGSWVLLEVQDNGTGMDAATLARVFEPFFTTKDPTRGTGLGMSTVYGIVQQWGGEIRVESQPGAGTRIRTFFPEAAARTLPPPEAARPAAAAAKSETGQTILLVEDENGVRKLVRGLLRSAGYRVLEAENAEQALKLAESEEGTIDLLLTDVVMPGISGRELADRLVAVRPDLGVLFSSGYTEDVVLRHGLMHSDVDLLSKPYTPAVLFDRVRKALARRAAADTAGRGAPVSPSRFSPGA